MLEIKSRKKQSTFQFTEYMELRCNHTPKYKLEFSCNRTGNYTIELCDDCRSKESRNYLIKEEII